MHSLPLMVRSTKNGTTEELSFLVVSDPTFQKGKINKTFWKRNEDVEVRFSTYGPFRKVKAVSRATITHRSPFSFFLKISYGVIVVEFEDRTQCFRYVSGTIPVE